jgi:hypothetical protein
MTLILASAVNLNGVQLLLMIALPAAAWAALVSGAPAWLWAVAAAAPLALVDPDAVNLVVADGLLQAYLMAAGGAMTLGWLLGALGVWMRPSLPRLIRPAVAGGLALASVLLAVALYGTVGQPGLYGDRLFVVLESQADLAALEATLQLAGPLERRQAVHGALLAHAEATQADLHATLARLGVGYTPYYLVNALEIEGGLPLRLWLALRPEVDRVLPSPVLRPWPAAPEPATGDEPAPTTLLWNQSLIGADRVWQEFGVRGEGVVIGQSDSGVQADHPALAATYRGRGADGALSHDYSWFDPWNGSPIPVDIDGHGTHTLGTILGDTTGIAPAATWIACANLVRNLGNPALYLDCMQFMLAPFPVGGDPWREGDPARGAHVLNNSWGCPPDVEGCDAAVFAPAMAALRAAGLFVVASAGNSGPLCGSVAEPIAIYDSVLTVGAIDRRGNLAPFSSAGPVTVDGSGRVKPDLTAPGVDILSSFPNSSYAVASGTSMAGPHVTGVVALMWSANPSLMGNVAATEALLLAAAHPFTGTLAGAFSPEETGEMVERLGEESPLLAWIAPPPDPDACLFQSDLETVPNNAAGYGVVDAFRAVELARSAR